MACSDIQFSMYEKGAPAVAEQMRLKRIWFGVLAVLGFYFVVGSSIATLFAQTNPILGEVELKGATKVEKTSGVWIDGQYVGYLGELKGRKMLMLLPGDHELSVRQAGNKDFAENM